MQREAITALAKEAWNIAGTLRKAVATVLAAFGLAAAVRDLFGMNWRGLLHHSVDIWDAVVRPVARWVLHVVVEIPCGWAGLHIVIPAALRDYLTLGAVVVGSVIRVQGFVSFSDPDSNVTSRRPLMRGLSRRRKRLVGTALAMIFWPVVIVFIIWSARFQMFPGVDWDESYIYPVTTPEQIEADRLALRASTLEAATILAPFLFLLVMLGVNPFLNS